MPRTLEIVVPPGKARERIDVFLTHHIENATRSKVQQAIAAGLVLVDGAAVRPSHKVSPGERIHVTIPKPPPQDALPEEIPLDIVYEDDALLVVNKPAGMVTHPAHGNYTGTLVNALLHHCRDHLSGSGDQLRPGIVHRLDKDTTGLMVVAKNDAVHAHLARQFARRTIDREYWAVVWGLFEGRRRGRATPKTGLIEAALGRSRTDRKKIAVNEGGKAAVTEYEVLAEFSYLSLLRLKLRTGRTHQIRVHLHHIGHPVFGDPVYGGRHMAGGGGEKKQRDEVQALLRLISRQALHAKTLGFTHPETGLRLRFDSELPADMNAVLSACRSGEGG